MSRTRCSASWRAPQSRDPLLLSLRGMGPGSAVHHAVKNGALRRVRGADTVEFPAPYVDTPDDRPTLVVFRGELR